MSHTDMSRPRMGATYSPGTVRARRWHGDGDVRGYPPPCGWTARALPRAVWWIVETKK